MKLRQSTAVIIQFGPFLDKADGVTLKTGLVSAIDHPTTGIMLSRNSGGTLSVRHATVTPSTYDAHGCYKVTLDTTDTAFPGTLRVIYTDATTILPVWADVEVLNAAEYDAVFGGATRTVIAASVTADVGITQVAADKVWNSAARTLTSFGTVAADAATAVWGVLTSALTLAGSVGKRIADNLDVTVGSRSTYAGADTPGTGTLLGRIPGTVQPQTGDAFARIGAGGVALTGLGDARVANLDATVSSRSTYAGADTPGTATLLGRLTAGRAANLDNLDALISALPATVWTAATRTLTAFGSVAADSANAVWAAASRTLTAFGFPVVASNSLTAQQTANAVWDALAVNHTITGTMGNTLIESGGGGAGVDPVAIAETLLKLDWTTVTGEADRSMLNALRSLRSHVSIVDNGDGTGTITVTKEDDATIAWTAQCLFDNNGMSISGVDPT